MIESLQLIFDAFMFFLMLYIGVGIFTIVAILSVVFVIKIFMGDQRL